MTDAHLPQPRRLLIISLLALSGIGLAGFLTWEFHAARASLQFGASCDISATVSCTDIARTHYAEVLPGLPLASLAGMFFAGVLALAALARRPALARPGARALQLLGLLGLATSLAYLYVMHFRIGKYCLFCLGVDAVNVALFIAVAGLRPGWRGRDGVAPWLRLILAGALCAGAAWGGLSLLKAPAERAALAAANGAAPGSSPASASSAAAAAAGPINPLTGEPMAAGGRSAEAALPPGLLPAAMPAEMREKMAISIENAISGPVETVGAGAEFPSEGPATAAVTIVEFADFQCPHCARAFALFKSLRAKYGGAVRIVYRQFPLSKRCNPLLKDWDVKRQSAPAAPEDFHAHACEEARLALCADAQGRYAEAAEALYAGIENIDKVGPAALLAGHGLDGARLNACARQPKTAARVAFDTEEGFRLGLHSTPTFFINGRRLEAIPLTLDYVVGRTLENQAAAPR